MIKVGKYDILIVEGKQIALIVNKTRIVLEMNPRQRELEARQMKESNMSIEKRIEKEKNYCQILVGKYFEGSYR